MRGLCGRCQHNGLRNGFGKGFSTDFIGSGSPEEQRGGVGKVQAQWVGNGFFDGFQLVLALPGCSAVVSEKNQRNEFSEGFLMDFSGSPKVSVQCVLRLSTDFKSSRSLEKQRGSVGKVLAQWVSQ